MTTALIVKVNIYMWRSFKDAIDHSRSLLAELFAVCTPVPPIYLTASRIMGEAYEMIKLKTGRENDEGKEKSTEVPAILISAGELMH